MLAIFRINLSLTAKFSPSLIILDEGMMAFNNLEERMTSLL